MLVDLIATPESGIAIIINEIDKEFYVISSLDMSNALAREVIAIKNGTHRSKALCESKDKLSFKFLEVVERQPNDDRVRLYGTHTIWENRYTAMGYTNISNRGRRPSIFRRVNVDLFYDVNNTPYAMVYLVQSAQSRYIIGVFETLDEAETWMKDNYPNSFNIEYKLASNELTDRYMANLQTDPDLNCFIRVTDPKVKKALREERRKQRLEKKNIESS